jgi:transcriptional regulator with XRE-family HTH domain
MLLDRLKTLKNEKNLTIKQIATKANLPEKTISRIFSGDTKNPYIDTLNSIAVALGSTLVDILTDTNIVVGTENLAILQDDNEILKSERDLLIAENEILKKKVDALTCELELVKTELMHNKKLLAVHEYYMKLKD